MASSEQNAIVTPSTQEFDALYDRVLDVYASLGYARDLVTHWALPRGDAQRLMELMIETQPTSVLEVGTFVGVTTLLMALHTRAESVIHTVDPNFPLSVELGAMHTQAGSSELAVRQQELGLLAARQLGIDHKIRFHAGGFSTGATFASAKQDPRNTVHVVGPEVCDRHGPFDFIFIDGLHYTDAVLGDLRLAHRYLRAGARIVVHDVIGAWGSNVRRAVFQFLSEVPEFAFTHGRYADVYDSIGVLQRVSDGVEGRSAGADTTNAVSLLDTPEFVSNLAALVTNVCAPDSVIYLGRDRGELLPRLAEFGANALWHVGDEPPYVTEVGGNEINKELFEFKEPYVPSRRFDVCISLGDGDFMGDRERSNLVESCVRCSDTILFAATPPGERNVAGTGSRPVGVWVREFWKQGYRFHDVLRPNFEPLRFAYSYTPIYKVTSSDLLNLYLIRRMPDEERLDLATLIERVLVEKESRIEDLSLQATFCDILLHDTLIKRKEAEDLLVQKDAELVRLSGEREKKNAELARLSGELVQKDAELARLSGELARLSGELARLWSGVTGYCIRLVQALARLRSRLRDR